MWWLTREERGECIGIAAGVGPGQLQDGLDLVAQASARYRPGRDRLSGRVEVDETYLGALEEGVRGRQTDAKALIVVAAEARTSSERTIPNSGDSLMAFVGESVEPGSVVHTDGWLGYGHSKATWR